MRRSYQAIVLLEMLLALAVLGVLFQVAQKPLLAIHQNVVKQQLQSKTSMALQRFQLVLKSELNQAGYGLPKSEWPQAVEIHPDGHLSLKADLNFDGDTNDSKEQISYYFDANQHQLKRKSKSGSGSPQRFIDGLSFISFSYFPTSHTDFSSLCLQVEAQIRVTEALESFRVCRI